MNYKHENLFNFLTDNYILLRRRLLCQRPLHSVMVLVLRLVPVRQINGRLERGKVARSTIGTRASVTYLQ